MGNGPAPTEARRDTELLRFGFGWKLLGWRCGLGGQFLKLLQMLLELPEAFAGMVQLRGALGQLHSVSKPQILWQVAERSSRLGNGCFAVANRSFCAVDLPLRLLRVAFGFIERETGGESVEGLLIHCRGVRFFLEDVDVGGSARGDQFFIGPDSDFVRGDRGGILWRRIGWSLVLGDRLGQR
jgi:hypothetical protein